MEPLHRQNPTNIIQTCFWLMATIAGLRIYETVELMTKGSLQGILKNTENACAAIPWLPRERVTLKDGSTVWISPITSGADLKDYYASLPIPTIKERLHLDSVNDGGAKFKGQEPDEIICRKVLEPQIADLAKQLDEGKIYVIGAHEGTTPIGIAEIIPLRDPRKAEANFSIHPRYQGKGLSAVLIAACLQHCAERGISIIYAEVDTNTPSRYIINHFPYSDRQQFGRDITLILDMDKHPGVLKKALLENRTRYLARLANSAPVPPPVKSGLMTPVKIAAEL